MKAVQTTVKLRY